MSYPRIGGSPAAVAPRERGFTLLEVLVAFAIAAPALVLLFGQGIGSVGAARTSALYQEAISRAKSRLETLSGRTLRAGEQSGDEAGGFHWRTRVVPLASVAAPRPPPGTSYAAGTTLFAVTVEVSWPGDSSARSITLDTRRLGPASADGP